MNITDYSIPKPSYPILLKLLAGLVITGLLGLGIVAYHTFNLVHGPIVAFIFAIVIEVGAAIDSIGLARGITRRTWWLIPAILITLIVSGWYNLAAVDKNAAALGVTDKATLALIEHAIAWGPLASLAFMALGVGFQIADHEKSVIAWQVNRQTWLDNQQAAQATTQKAHQEMELHDKEQERALAARLELEKEKARLASEQAVQLAQIASEQAAQLARVASEERQAKRELRVQASQQLHSASVITQELHKGSYQEFVDASKRRNGAGPFSVDEIQSTFKVSRKTAYNWINKKNDEKSVSIETGLQ
jgi:hypothetical protein